jgi:hypothetical protein
MRIECVITHDGKNWIAANELFSLCAPSLEELDGKVRNLVREKGMVRPGEKAEVFMAFNNSAIPAWIRPYAQHYFNRIVVVEGDLA